MLDVKLIYSLNCDILLKQYTVKFSLTVLQSPLVCSVQPSCGSAYADFLKDSFSIFA